MHVPAYIPQPAKLNGDYTRKTHFDRTHVWNKVRPRCMLPTPYMRELAWMTHEHGETSFANIRGVSLFIAQLVSNHTLYAYTGRDVDSHLVNLSYERLVNRIRSSDMRRGGDPAAAEIGVTLLEYGKTRKWVADSLEAVADYTWHIKHASSDRRIAEARRRVLESRRKRKRKKVVNLTVDQRKRLINERWRVPRWLGSRWLEYWMIVAPTLGDIHTGLQVLSRDVHVGEVHATARMKGAYKHTDIGLINRTEEEAEVFTLLRQSCTLRCVNPNTALAQSLGLLNPLLIVGEVVAWTWLLNWFVNWKTVLGAWTDFAGYEVSKTYVTRFQSITGTNELRNKNTLELKRRSKYFTTATRRTVGAIAYPTLQVSVPEALSWQRAATSISLVVNLFTQR